MTQDNQNSGIFAGVGVVDDTLARTLIADHVAGKTDAVTPMSEAFKAIDNFRAKKLAQRSEPIIKKQALFNIEGTEFGIYSGLASIFANEGEGKSQCANIICQSALKDPNRKVIVIDTEQGADEVRRRERTISFEYSEQLEVIYFPDFCDAVRDYASGNKDAWNLFKTYYLDSLKAGDLVVIDVVADIVGDINDQEYSQLFVADIQQLANAKRCCIIIVNHYNKNTTNSAGWIGTELLKKSYMNIHVQRAYKKKNAGKEELAGLSSVAESNDFQFVAVAGIVDISGNLWQTGKIRFKRGQWFGWNRRNDDNTRRVEAVGEIDGLNTYDNIEYYQVIGRTNQEAGELEAQARKQQLIDIYHLAEMPKEGLGYRGDSSGWSQWVRQYNPEAVPDAVFEELKSADLVSKANKKIMLK